MPSSDSRAGRLLRLTPLLLAIGLVCGGCGSDAPSQPSPPPPPPVSSVTVSSITDGDTLRFSPPLEGTSILRLLDVDTAETTQVPWGDLARAELLRLAPPQTELRLETEQMHIDPFGRLLAHAIRLDGLDVNKELLRLGQAVLFVIWPNVGRFEDYRAAEIEAQAEGRGVWNPANPLTELPFEYRLRIDRDTPFRPVGDFFTRRYVDAGRLPARRREQSGLLQQHDRRGVRRDTWPVREPARATTARPASPLDGSPRARSKSAASPRRGRNRQLQPSVSIAGLSLVGIVLRVRWCEIENARRLKKTRAPVCSGAPGRHATRTECVRRAASASASGGRRAGTCGRSAP